MNALRELRDMLVWVWRTHVSRDIFGDGVPRPPELCPRGPEPTRHNGGDSGLAPEGEPPRATRGPPNSLLIEGMVWVEELKEWANPLSTPDIYVAEAWLDRQLKAGKKAYYAVTVIEPTLISSPPDVDMDEHEASVV